MYPTLVWLVMPLFISDYITHSVSPFSFNGVVSVYPSRLRAIYAYSEQSPVKFECSVSQPHYIVQYSVLPNFVELTWVRDPHGLARAVCTSFSPAPFRREHS